MNYQSALEMLRGRDSKVLVRNLRTTLYKDEDDVIRIQLVNTSILTFWPDGRVVLRDGGWRTLTTRNRFNDYLPDGWSVYQEKSVWYLHSPPTNGSWESRRSYTYEDGITLTPAPNSITRYTVSGTGPDPKEIQKAVRAVNAYVRKFVDELFKGNVPAPGGGDCWMCGLRVADELDGTLGERWNDDHIHHHIEEKYYVPSLLTRAIEVYPISPVARGVLHDIWSGRRGQEGAYHESWDDLVKDQLRKSLRRYIRRQLNLPS